MSEEERPEECEGCHFEGVPLTFYNGPKETENSQDTWLCDVCVATGMYFLRTYPAIYGARDERVLQTLCWCTNRILRALEEKG